MECADDGASQGAANVLMARAARSALVALLLLTSVAAGTAGCVSCPTALVSGVLVADGSDLALASADGAVVAVTWPEGYQVGLEDGRLVLTDFLGAVKARQGDRIEMGSGLGADDVFHGCGELKVSQVPA